MIDTVQKFADRYSMLPLGGNVLAAVSGGADSMCLLHILNVLKDKYGYNLIVLHYNHCLRGEESDRDEEFVVSHCRSLGVKCIVGRGNVSEYAKQNSLGIEEAARNMRYAFFEKCASEYESSVVATAHNADDNAETVLMNLARGSGAKGVSGIPPVRGIYVRPLLILSRASICAYLDQYAAAHVEDSTNAYDIYTRNRLRHHVMPELKKINPKFSENLLRTCQHIRDDDDCLTALADEFIKQNRRGNSLPVKALIALPFAIKTRVIRLMSESHLSSQHVEAVLDLCTNPSPSASTDIPGLTVCREYDKIQFLKQSESVTFCPTTLTVEKPVIIHELGLKITCTHVKAPDIVHKSLTEFLFKTDNIYGTIIVRPRLTGDFIHLSGRSSGKTLKKLFIEKRIPLRNREAVPVIADENGVLAVYGIGADKRTEPMPGNDAVYIKFEEF